MFGETRVDQIHRASVGARAGVLDILKHAACEHLLSDR
ncbi:hypothetical protein SAMN05421543_10118 [Alicyclobacillus macrosporangiidus]|uniref:Uncharacterized protein n=1 Tax=Alicyclobacillus macrosporangiidus TaxID=392015 RepID=A0A1I7F1W2_9BACL|nr:hypothetical protein SAMN05421543_10118 [Alicyclobacillus macrosporangiidus]